jgi:PAS domain S-box-containing protein
VLLPDADDAEGSSHHAAPPGAGASVFVAVVGVMLSVGLGFALRTHERSTADSAIEALLEHVRTEVSYHLSEEVENLADLAHRWEQRGGMARADWEGDAARLVERFGHIQAIEWVDASFVVRWIVPMEGNEAASGLDLSLEEHRRAALEHARETREIGATDPVELVQGGRGFLVYVPVHVGDRFEGFVLGVYRLDELFDSVLDTIKPELSIVVSDRNSELHRRDVDPPGRVEWLTASRDCQIQNLRWRIAAQPSRSFESVYLTELPLVISVAGIAISVLLSFLLHHGRRERWRASGMAQSNSRLTDEVGRRNTAEQELREAKEELQLVMSSIPDHLWSLQFDSAGWLVNCFHSPVVEQITGRPAEYFLGGVEPWLGIVHEDDSATVWEAFDQLIRGETNERSLEVRILWPDGSLRWIRKSIRASQMPDRTRRLNGVVTDITDRKVAEERQRRQADEMAHSDRVNTLGRMATNIAHELNQPLLAIMNYASVCRREIHSGKASRESIENDLEQVVEQGERAGEIIRRLRDFVRMRELEKAELDLNEVLRDAVRFVEFEARERGLRVDLDLRLDEPRVSGDPVLLQQVVLNLIRNALDATESTPEAEGVHVSASETGAGGVEVAVLDSGVGVAEEDLERLFEPFFSTKANGLGMGLSICRSIVESHEGQLVAARKESGGMRFSFTLPVDRSPQP